MAAYKKIDENLSISGQIFVGHLDKIKAQGFTTIICNRPDFEEDPEDQPLADDIQNRASELGLEFVYIPIDDSGPNMKAVHKTKEALDTARGPVLAYCLSGKRSLMLYSLAKAFEGHSTTDELISKAISVGYNLNGLRPTLDFVAA